MNRRESIEGGGLRIDFQRRGDRYGHTISVSGSTGPVTILESEEGSDSDRWPPSPPLQELHIEQRGGGVVVALLVGMAGSSHWSASVELRPDESLVRFDVACRATQQPAWLGSGYHTGDSAWSADSPHAVQTTSAGMRCCVLTEAATPFPPGSLSLAKERIQLTAPLSATPQSGTVRWKYRIVLRRAAGIK